jgi:UDP-glucose 4-epimerase
MITDKRILITGGLGFVGSHLVDSLVKKNHVTVVDDLSTGRIENINMDAVTYVETVDEYIRKNRNEKFDIIFHFANCARIARSFEFCEDTLLNNYNSTVLMCEFIKRKNPHAKLIFASSSTTEFADKFNNPYTFSKVVCDEVLQLYKKHYELNFDVVKFYNVFGSDRESLMGEYTTIIRKFMDAVEKDELLTVYGTGAQSRDFTYIGDTIEALHIVGNLPSEGKTYHIGTGKSTQILEVAQTFKHKYYHAKPRAYEVAFVMCKEPNVPGWKAKTNVIDWITAWKEGCNE